MGDGGGLAFGFSILDSSAIAREQGANTCGISTGVLKPFLYITTG